MATYHESIQCAEIKPWWNMHTYLSPPLTLMLLIAVSIIGAHMHNTSFWIFYHPSIRTKRTWAFPHIWKYTPYRCRSYARSALGRKEAYSSWDAGFYTHIPVIPYPGCNIDRFSHSSDCGVSSVYCWWQFWWLLYRIETNTVRIYGIYWI